MLYIDLFNCIISDIRSSYKKEKEKRKETMKSCYKVGSVFGHLIRHQIACFRYELCTSKRHKDLVKYTYSPDRSIFLPKPNQNQGNLAHPNPELPPNPFLSASSAGLQCVSTPSELCKWLLLLLPSTHVRIYRASAAAAPVFFRFSSSTLNVVRYCSHHS